MKFKQMLSEIEFALKNGFTTIKRDVEKDGSLVFLGTFGYYAVNEEEAKEIENLIAQYVKVEKETETFEETLTKIFGNKFEIKNEQIKSLLNENVIEVKVKGKGPNAKYSFLVENDKDNHYTLGASLTAKGKWWVKRARTGL